MVSSTGWNPTTGRRTWAGWDKFWAGFGGETTDLSQIESVLKLNFDAESVAQLSAYVGELVAAIQQGGEISEEDIANLQAISEMLNGLDTYGIGTHITEGVAQGMTEAGWSSDAETVAANLEAALNSALGIQSPSTRMKPTGSNVAAGVGAGMGEYDFTGEASSLAGRLSGAVSAAMPASLLRPAGLNAMRGLTAGINAGRSGVIAAMRSAARAAVNAAKSELKIKSPSTGIRGRSRRNGDEGPRAGRAQGKQGAGAGHPQRRALPDGRGEGREHHDHEQRQPAHLQPAEQHFLCRQQFLHQRPAGRLRAGGGDRQPDPPPAARQGAAHGVMGGLITMDHAHYAINVTGGELPDAELAAYLERGKQKYGKQLLGLDVHLDGEYVELTYHLRRIPFDRVRRITGYLVGTLDRFNDGKRAEERDRVKHSIGGSDERLV